MIAGLMAIEEGGGALSGLASLAIYTDVFGRLGLLAVVLGVLVLLVSPFLHRRMHLND